MLRCVSDARLDQVNVALRHDIEAPVGAFLTAQVLDHHAAFEARIRHKLAQRLLQRPFQNLGTGVEIPP